MSENINLENLSAIGESMPGGFFVYRAGGSEEIIYANSVMISILGCEDYEDFKSYTGKSFRGIVYPDDYILTNHDIQVQISTDNVHFDHVGYRIQRKDGQIRFLNDYGRLVHSKDYGDVFFVFVSDETDQYIRQDKSSKQAMDAMDAIHLALGSGDWSMTFDEQGEMASCSWSQRFRDMVGYPSISEFPDRLESWSDLLHPEDKERVLEHYWDVVKDYSGKKTYDVYYRINTGNRGERWFRAIGRLTRRVDGTPVVFYGIFLDVDDEMKSRIAEKNQNSAILEAISRDYHTMWLITKKDLKMHFIRSNGNSTIQNAVNMGMGNANVDEALGKYINKYVVEEDRERVTEAVKSEVVLEQIKNRPIYNVNYRRTDDEGNVTFHQMAFADAGEGFILAYHDIDSIIREEKAKQDFLRDALNAAEAANHAKSVFLQTMSHDIRTPMNGIVGMTAIAASHIDDRERVVDCLQKITSASRHLLSLINEVLDMSRIESGKVVLSEEEFNLSKLVDDMLSMIRPQVKEHHHEIKTTVLDVQHENVIGDPIRIQQVFVNLMSNAIKYTPDGGKISFGIREIPCNQLKTACFEFTFMDNGIGMSEELVERIFEPFVRGEDGRTSKIQGTGLGMAISRNIVNMMGGDIKVTSKPNCGSTFKVTVYLKLQDKEYDENCGFADLRVLVADDDVISKESAVDILEELGMRAIGVDSGEEAVRSVSEEHEKHQDFNAVVLDWKMPGMDGVETTREIRRRVGDEIPIIILSAYDWTDIEEEAKVAGVNAFISKPLFKSRLARIFSELFLDEEDKKTESSPVDELADRDLSNYRCLLAEDNELNAEIVMEILEDTGLKIDHVEDGAQAVEKMSDTEIHYDIILMDIQMPKLDGYAATEQIRAMDNEYCRSIPIIAMTANAFAEDVHRALSAGMNEHVSKPIEIKSLIKIIDKYLLGKNDND